MIVLHWFRNDLRLADNPALTSAAESGKVLPIYIVDQVNAGAYAPGAASNFWLHHSLTSLNQDLMQKLNFFVGDPAEILLQICQENNVELVTWNRCYEPWQMQRDTAIKKLLLNQGIEVRSFNGSLLWEPWHIAKSDGSPYKVFTPFYRKGCLMAAPPRMPLPKPVIQLQKSNKTQQLSDLNLLPKQAWGDDILPLWEIGEAGAAKRLESFIVNGLQHYKDGRNLPAMPYVSRLSPHLRSGEISPNQIWYAVQDLPQDRNTEHFCSELGWREFSYNLLYFNHDLPTKNLQVKFDNFPWEDNPDALLAWQKGLTGIPMVDAGMRELWQTGFMHNRVRMIVGSFLIKNLRLHWHHGERWFWDTLFDADLASNSASWQWVAGCGADAAPYFRIFNPVTQGQKFDPEGAYIRKFIPEIAHVPDKHLYSPWESGLDLEYPSPIVELKRSREAALAAFQTLKSEQ